MIEAEEVNYLAIKASGDPSQHEFAARIQTFLRRPYVVKFRFKAHKKDFVVPKLERLWWLDEPK